MIFMLSEVTILSSVTANIHHLFWQYRCKCIYIQAVQELVSIISFVGIAASIREEVPLTIIHTPQHDRYML